MATISNHVGVILENIKVLTFGGSSKRVYFVDLLGI